MTVGARAVVPLTIQPWRRLPSAATPSSGSARIGKCAVEMMGCGKKISRSCVSHAVAKMPSVIAAAKISHSIALRLRCIVCHRSIISVRLIAFLRLAGRQDAVARRLNGHRYFKVRASDRSVYILRHDEAAGEWKMSFFSERPA